MGYLERNSAKRVAPDAVLPGARSIVCLAASYESPNSAAKPESGFESPRGVIARYAQFTDYHDILGERPDFGEKS